jgi:hypothetical protein
MQPDRLEKSLETACDLVYPNICANPEVGGRNLLQS